MGMTDTQIRKVFAKRLQQVIQKKGLSLQALSDKSGVSPAALMDYIVPLDSPPLEDLVRISAALNISIDRLVGRSGNRGSWVQFCDGWFTLYKCSRCGNVVGSDASNRMYCEKCGSKNGEAGS